MSSTRFVTTGECRARMAEIEAKLGRMGMTVTEARERRARYQLTQAQYSLVREYEGLVWLAS